MECRAVSVTKTAALGSNPCPSTDYLCGLCQVTKHPLCITFSTLRWTNNNGPTLMMTRRLNRMQSSQQVMENAHVNDEMMTTLPPRFYFSTQNHLHNCSLEQGEEQRSMYADINPYPIFLFSSIFSILSIILRRKMNALLKSRDATLWGPAG